jgi:hypothetical protein
MSVWSEHWARYSERQYFKVNKSGARAKKELDLKPKILYGMFAVVVIASLGLWSTDKITWQGERTVYTVQCHGGSWQENRCTGELTAGPRFRYRALVSHKEVVFWVVGSTESSGKLTDCSIEDGRHWKCPENADALRSITLEMAHGVPIHRPPDQPLQFHSVSKFDWSLLNIGVRLKDTAE